MRSITVILLALAAILPLRAASAEPQRLALLPFELDDSSGEGPRAEQDKRLRMMDAELRAALSASSRYAPVEASLPPGTAAVRGCNRCDIAAAERAGTPLVLTGVVRKVSTLILSMTLIVREAPSGVTRNVWTADFRGNNDESWQHALRWLLRNRVLAEPQP